jgi:hypothetical protein
MSKYYRKKKPVAQPTEEMIKAVFEVYRPNKLQLFAMRKFSLNGPLTGNKERVRNISNILKFSEDKILVLELEYYLNK